MSHRFEPDRDGPRLRWVPWTTVPAGLLMAVLSIAMLASPAPQQGDDARGIPAFGPSAPVLYSVTFTASGLPSGASWNLTVQALTPGGTNVTPSMLATTNASVVLRLASGTYGYSAFAPSARTASAAGGEYLNGSFLVAGANRTVPLIWTYTSAGPTSGSTAPASSAGAGAYPLVATTAVASVVVLLTVLVIVLVRRPVVRALPRDRPSETSTRPPDGPVGVAAAPEASSDPLRHML